MDMMRMWYWIRRVDSDVDAKEQEITFLNGCCAVGLYITADGSVHLFKLEIPVPLPRQEHLTLRNEEKQSLPCK
jgi:hypothetical protein